RDFAVCAAAALELAADAHPRAFRDRLGDALVEVSCLVNTFAVQIDIEARPPGTEADAERFNPEVLLGFFRCAAVHHPGLRLVHSHLDGLRPLDGGILAPQQNLL